MNVSRHFRQTATWEVREDPDEWGDYQYSGPQEIMVRKVGISRASQGTGGPEDRAINNVYTLSPVSLGDKIDGEVVQTREEWPDLRYSGTVYKLYMEPVQRS